MSFKDGIPLKSTEDDPDKDEYDIHLNVGKQCCKSNHSYMCLGLALLLVLVVIATFAVGITLGFLFSGSTKPTSTPLPASSCEDDNVICPSTRDDRIYKFLTLESNGLRVVLISDPNTDLSGASMSVAAGSFNNPANYTGLAHFCEHMLFLGTKKYPDKNEYSKYLSTHGGSHNAYTSTQETNYFLEIQDGYLERALDMFAHFFIDPLFSAIYTEKELNAVNQEHQKNLLLDAWKKWQLLKHVSNPNHPFSQFSTGNFETLNKTDIRYQLIQFYNKSYSASTVSYAMEVAVGEGGGEEDGKIR